MREMHRWEKGERAKRGKRNLFLSLLVVPAIVFALFPPRASAQVIRLPAVLGEAENENVYPGRLVSHPDSSSELLQAPGTADAATVEPDGPPGSRPGVFQKLIFSGTWLAPGVNHGFGMSDLDLRAVLGFACPTRRSPLLVTPGFAVHYLEGPIGADLPPQVYDAYAQFRWMHEFTPRFAVDLAVTPGVFGDFDEGADDAIRVAGHAVVVWTCGPNLKLLLGAAYLDREDIGVLPAGGLIWTPYDELKFELIVPRPRIAARLACDGDVEDWAYFAGEFGGGTWAIRRTGGGSDVLNYRDWRLVLGIERKAVHGPNTRLELAYVFGRELQFDSAAADITPTDTIMLRAGVTY